MSTSAYFWIIGSMAKCLAMSLQSLPLAWVRDVSIRDVEPSSISNEVTFRALECCKFLTFHDTVSRERELGSTFSKTCPPLKPKHSGLGSNINEAILATRHVPNIMMARICMPPFVHTVACIQCCLDELWQSGHFLFYHDGPFPSLKQRTKVMLGSP